MRRKRVERARGFVAQHNLRVRSKGARNGDALLLAARKLAGVIVRLAGKSHEFEQFERASFGLFLRRAMQFERERDVAQHRALGEQAEILENHANGLAQIDELLAGIVGHIGAIDEHAARRGTLEQVDAANERRLARARLADDAEHVARLNMQVDIAQRLVRAGRADIGFRKVV